MEAEIAEEWSNDQVNKDKLISLIKSIVAFDMKHNAEIQACDLLMEIDLLELLEVDKSNYLKVCLYLIKWVFHCFLCINRYLQLNPINFPIILNFQSNKKIDKNKFS